MLLDLKALARAFFRSVPAAATPDPAPVEAGFAQAVALHQRGELADAEAAYAAVLSADPDHCGALGMLGILAYQTSRPGRAVDLLSRAVAIDPGQPGVHSNLALALNAVGRGRDAIASCDRAIALDPGCVEAHSNRGNSLWGLGRREEALDSYARALALDPGHAQTHWNEGFLRLQLGQYETGWQKQEWRWQLPLLAASRRDFTQPAWLGRDSLAGKTILLHAEQGFGDTLQFCRYAPLVAARGATVVLEVQPPLKSLLASLEGVSRVIARGEALPPFDTHCPLWSLPLAFGTRLETIPAGPGYIRPPPETVTRWRDRLGPRTVPRIGFAWRGSNADWRSVPLAGLVPLLAADAQFLCLQKDLTAADRELLGRHRNVQAFDHELADFSDTAALIELADLVITIDTSVAHLAGAMGRPAWILLPFNPDWRWLLDRTDSPWYPSARLFRQPAPDDWAGALGRIALDLPEKITELS